MGAACSCCCAKDDVAPTDKVDITRDEQEHQQRLAARGARYVVQEEDDRPPNHEPIANKAEEIPPPPRSARPSAFDPSALLAQERAHRAQVEAEEERQRDDLAKIIAWHYDRTIQEEQQISMIRDELTVVHSPSRASSVSRGGGGGGADRMDDDEYLASMASQDDELLRLKVLTEEYLLFQAESQHLTMLSMHPPMIRSSGSRASSRGPAASPSPMRQLFGPNEPVGIQSSPGKTLFLDHDEEREDDEEDDLLVDPIAVPQKPPQPHWKHFHDSEWRTGDAGDVQATRSFHVEPRPSSAESFRRGSSSSSLSPLRSRRPVTGPMHPAPYSTGVTVHMIEELHGLPSARDKRIPFQRQSLDHPELNMGHHEVLANDPLLGVELSETSGRDVILRYQQFELHELLLLETQEGSFRRMVAIGQQYVTFYRDQRLLALCREESQRRLHWLQDEAFHRLTMWQERDLRDVHRREAERYAAEMEARARRSMAAEAEAKELRRLEKTKADRLKWAVERERMQRNRFGAKEKLYAELEAVRAANEGRPVVVDGLSKRQKRIREELSRYQEEEHRWRNAMIAEEDSRWTLIVDDAIRAAPFLFCRSVTTSELISAKQEAMLKDALLALQRVEKRIQGGGGEDDDLEADRSNAAAKQSWLDKQFEGLAAALAFDEHEQRKIVFHKEMMHRGALGDQQELEWDIHHAHDLRRQAEVDAVLNEQRAIVKREESVRLLQRCGRSSRTRQGLRDVLPVGIEVATLVEDHRRADKFLRMHEGIIRGDIAHYCVLLWRMAFGTAEPQLLKHSNDLYPWSVDCVSNIELMRRDADITLPEHAAFVALETAFQAARQEIASHPLEVQMRRYNAAHTIQRFVRAVWAKRKFDQTQRDALVLAREMRRKLRAEKRLWMDKEVVVRATLEEALLDELERLHAQRECFLAERREEWHAATVIQRTFRGWRCRLHVVPPLEERYLKDKLHALEHRSRGSK